jgi:hypothetical protein
MGRSQAITIFPGNPQRMFFIQAQSANNAGDLSAQMMFNTSQCMLLACISKPGLLEWLSWKTSPGLP